MGIVLNSAIQYHNASLRYFKEGEHHIKRFCRSDVLLLVFDGVLRFSENGKEYEIKKGQYHIQRHDTFQDGILPSDKPQYLYVHFYADWDDGENTLPPDGTFSFEIMEELIYKLDKLYHENSLIISQIAVFYEILSVLATAKSDKSLSAQIANYLKLNYASEIKLADLCDRFYFSKNHIINTFKKTYGITPNEYLILIRLQKAKRQLEITSDNIENVALCCGFRDYSYFYKTFTKYEKLSPKKWRKSRQRM